MFIRSVFAMVEGLTYRMKQQAKHSSMQFTGAPMTPAEISIIDEERYELSTSLKVVPRPNNIPIDKNFRFALKIFAEAHGGTLTYNVTQDPRWAAFRRSQNVRNRIVHPKGAADLIISDKELSEAQDALELTTDAWAEALVEGFPFMREQLAQLKTNLRANLADAARMWKSFRTGTST